MDPLSVLKALWNHRLVAGCALGITLLAASWVFFFGPVTYESSSAYALLNPRIPTETEVAENPKLGDLNGDNPYLRSSDNSLAAQVLITQLSSDATAESLAERGLSTDYVVARGDSGGQGLLIGITAFGSTADQSTATTAALGVMLSDKLREIQKIDDADDRFLYTALQVDGSGVAKEQVSNRLRATLVVGIAGFVLIFAAVSISRAIDSRPGKRRPPEPETLVASAPRPPVRPARPRTPAVSPGPRPSALRRAHDSGGPSRDRASRPSPWD